MEKKIIWGILILAFLLRVTLVTKFPVGFNADEASFGYDAYSILHTGRDQWGNFLPIVLKSFGDYKLPLYSYISLPSVALLGLNIFAVRLPSVIIGTLAVFITYLLSNEIFKKKLDYHNLSFGLIPAFLLAVNPWAVMLSRGAFEANLVTFFIPGGLYFFLKGIKKPKNFSWSAVFFGLTLFSYHSAKIIVPLLIIFLCIYYIKELFKVGLKKLVLPILILLLFSGAVVYTLSIGGGSRVAERSITQGALVEGATEKIRAIGEGVNPLVAKFIHNKYTVIAGRFQNNYLQYFSPKFLFAEGVGESYYGMVKGIGVVYIFEGLMFLGLIFLIKKGLPEFFPVLLFWLIIAPLPAALATGVGYSGNRASGMLAILQILEGLGLIGWFNVFKELKANEQKILLFSSVFFIFLSVYRFLVNYTQKVPISSYQQMLYGNLEAFKIMEEKYAGKKIIVSRSLSEPQIFIAFVNKWDPKDYQKETKNWDLEGNNVAWVDQIPEYSLGRYTIKSIDWNKDKTKNVVFLAKPDGFPKDIKPDRVISYPDGSPSIYVKSY